LKFFVFLEFRNGFMPTHLHQLTGRAFRAVAAGVLIATLVFLGLPGAGSQAVAAPKGTLTETMDLKMTKAAQEFVESILDDYSDALEDSFSEALKPLKSVTKDLTKLLGKAAAAPDSISATTLAPKIEGAKTVLDSAAASFDTLVADTAKFKSTLDTTPSQLKEAIDTQLGTQFDDLQTAFEGVSKAIAALSEDTVAAAADPAAAATALTEHATLLTEAIASAKAVISTFGESAAK
jgi:acetylornithine deacetylase/succinyl-diaminopimelate desuccinylase-like protein